jgi:hypothetical protein
MIIDDNNWHDGILVWLPGERLALFSDKEQAIEECPELTKVSGPIEFNPISYNWNHGQMQVRMSNGDIATVVDITYTKKPD